MDRDDDDDGRRRDVVVPFLAQSSENIPNSTSQTVQVLLEHHQQTKMAKFVALFALFAIFAMAMAAPAEEKKDLQTASGIGLGYYGLWGYKFPSLLPNCCDGYVIKNFNCIVSRLWVRD
ncbi:hypothetical protein Ocin01_00712 [Orchesella cincta]|uniref:Uncharacterized protein n=1 Tax=Orchesella cincta TaxID=48709 RepID=A0A1D2NL66_ORCCI|nr:hypothetical protein Ocin01_00712 [Orchesella cincta]